ncbi:Uncharacterised protein [uncultured archaeon]|nr:Uncharacterised protein [uncultured archaeon]
MIKYDISFGIVLVYGISTFRNDFYYNGNQILFKVLDIKRFRTVAKRNTKQFLGVVVQINLFILDGFLNIRGANVLLMNVQHSSRGMAYS